MRDRYVFAFDVPPEALWRALSDTDALNRDAGLPPIAYRSEPGERGMVTVAAARLGPLRLEWDEPPFVWEAPHRLALDRRFRSGPFTRFFTEIRIEPHEVGARVEQRVELEPRGALGALLAPFVLARARRGTARAYDRAVARVRAARDAGPTRETVPDVPPAPLERVTRFVDACEPLVPHAAGEAEIAARLASLVANGDDATVSRMRPYVLADSWELPRIDVLGAMLAATRAGLLDLSWTIVCPSCRGPKNAVDSLTALRTAGWHCPSCGIAYDAEFDRNVEVTFDAVPSGRTATPPVYCLAGPETARQARAQAPLAPGESLVLAPTLAPGAYVVQAIPGRAARLCVESDAGAGAVDVRIDDGAVRLSSAVARAGTVRFTFASSAGAAAVVRIAEAPFSHQMATAAEVSAVQAFRDLFSSEVLADGIEVAIRSLTFVFSDVVGSTAMYGTVGDARAFRMVHEHFAALSALVARHRGAIVKTIGDAVMAVFPDPRDGVAAALGFSAAAAPLPLRVGVHRGPSIAIAANRRIDYFGATVNVASRVAHAAGAGEVLVTASAADDPAAAELLGGGESGILALRGIDEPVEVVRVGARPAIPR